MRKKKDIYLPDGWVSQKLVEAGDVFTGNTPPRRHQEYYGDDIPWVRPPDLESGMPIFETEEQLSTLGAQKARVLPAKAVLVSCIGTLGKVGILGCPGATNQQINSIVFKDHVIPEYGYYFCQTLEPILERLKGTSTVKIVKKSLFETIDIPVPPLVVQERIIQILQKADEIRLKNREALELANAILPAAYRDLFGEPDANPFDWPIEPLGKYIVESRYGTSEKTGAHTQGDAVLRIPNVLNRTIDTTYLKYLEVDETVRKKLLLYQGDILVVRTNGNKNYVGRSAVFNLKDDYIFASYLIRLRVMQEYLNPHYVVAFLATSFGRKEIELNTRTSAGQYNISAKGLCSIRIPVPPISRQKKFLDQYEQWRQTTTSLEKGQSDIDSVRASLLSRAFTGELTAEWEAENVDWIASQITG